MTKSTLYIAMFTLFGLTSLNAQKNLKKDHIDKAGNVSTKLSDLEKQSVKNARKIAILEKYDTDGDGILSIAEKTVARENQDHTYSASSDHEAWKQKMLQKFDLNGDHKLSDEEKAALTKSMRQRNAKLKAQREQIKADFLTKNDTNGDGKLSKEERKAAYEAKKREILNLFDVDTNGKLEGEERNKALEWLKANQPSIETPN